MSTAKNEFLDDDFSKSRKAQKQKRNQKKSVLAENKRDTYANIQNMNENRIAEKNFIKSENTMHKTIINEKDKKPLPGKEQENNNWPSWDEISDHMSDDEKDFILD